MELRAKCLAQAMTYRRTPRVRAAPNSPRITGSSPYVSCARPQAGWRSRLMQTPAKKLPPWAATSAPIARPTRSSSSMSQVAPRAIETGNAVDEPITTPRGPSLKRRPGMPSRSTAPWTIGM